MKRYLIYADPHWSSYSSIIRKRGEKYSVRLHNLIQSLNWVEETAEKYNCSEIICLGDFFDRESLNCEEISALKEVKWGNIHKKFIVGNHESNLNSLQFSSTQVFSSINAEIIDKYKEEMITDNIMFKYIPYTKPGEIEPLEKESVKSVVFAHLDIAGMKYGKFTSQVGLELDTIRNNCDLFFDGHLHSNLEQDNLILVGNLTGQNFNEDAIEHKHKIYILTIDDNDISYTSIENPYAFNFYRRYIECESDLNLLRHLLPNSVLSINCQSEFTSKVVELLENNKDVVAYRIAPHYNNLSNTSDFNLNSNNNFLQQFIEFAYEKLEPSSLRDDELSRLGG